MRWLFKFLDWTARPIPLVVIIATLLAFRSWMQPILDTLQSISGESLPDYEFGYSRERLIEIFGKYGAEGVALYRRFMTFDLVFPFIYSLSFSSLLHLVLASTRFRMLACAPFLISAFDYVENALFYVILESWPDISGIIVAIANVTTVGKFGFGAVSAIAGIIAIAVLVRSWFKLA